MSGKRIPGFLGRVLDGNEARLYVILCRFDGKKVDRHGNTRPGETHDIVTYRLTHDEAGWWNHEERDRPESSIVPTEPSSVTDVTHGALSCDRTGRPTTEN